MTDGCKGKTIYLPTLAGLDINLPYGQVFAFLVACSTGTMLVA